MVPGLSPPCGANSASEYTLFSFFFKPFLLLHATKIGHSRRISPLLFTSRAPACYYFVVMSMATRRSIEYEQHAKQRKIAEETERVIAHYRGLEEVTPDFIFIVDRELVIRYVNRSAARLLKKDVPEMTGKYLELFFPPAAYEAQFQRLQEVFRSGTTATGTNLVPFAGTDLFLNTKAVPIKDLLGNVSAVLSISRDVSELRPNLVCGRPDSESLLSEREEQVLNLVAAGMTNKEIGQALFISPKTVDVHRTRIMKKLDAHNTAELILRSRQTGLLV